jgi:hypothetical protein
VTLGSYLANKEKLVGRVEVMGTLVLELGEGMEDTIRRVFLFKV